SGTPAARATDGEHGPGPPGDCDVRGEPIRKRIPPDQAGSSAPLVEAAETEIGELVPVDVVELAGERRIRGRREAAAAAVGGAGPGGELDLTDIGRRQRLGADVRRCVRAAFLRVGQEGRY